MQLTFESASNLAQALLRAGLAHGKYEEELGLGRDQDWPNWYAQYIEREQAGEGTNSLTKETSRQPTFGSTSDLARALLRAEQAHGQYEEQIGRPVPDWPNWYAQYFERELAGEGASA